MRQDRVAAGHQPQVQRRLLGGRGAPRIDDDQLAASQALRLEVLHDRRHRLRDVGADEQDGVGLGDVGDGERQAAIEPEGAQARRRGRRHAEAAVVVDVRRAERDARELAEQVDLLVGQRAAAEDAHRVAAVLALHDADGGADALDRVIPVGRDQLAGGVADERRDQTFGMRQRLAGGEALRAERASVHREVRVAGNRDAAILGGRGEHAALERAVWAVRPNRTCDGAVDLRNRHVAPTRPRGGPCRLEVQGGCHAPERPAGFLGNLRICSVKCSAGGPKGWSDSRARQA